MSATDPSDFYRRREQQERALARFASSPAVKAIHLDLAQRYADLIAPFDMSTARAQLRSANA